MLSRNRGAGNRQKVFVRDTATQRGFVRVVRSRNDKSEHRDACNHKQLHHGTPPLSRRSYEHRRWLMLAHLNCYLQDVVLTLTEELIRLGNSIQRVRVGEQWYQV